MFHYHDTDDSTTPLSNIFTSILHCIKKVNNILSLVDMQKVSNCKNSLVFTR